MKRLTLLLALLASLAFVASASALQPRAYWSQSYAELQILNSAWADDQGVDNADCHGRGRARLDTQQVATFRLFACTVYVLDDETNSESGYPMRLTVIQNPDNFLLKPIIIAGAPLPSAVSPSVAKMTAADCYPMVVVNNSCYAGDVGLPFPRSS